MSHAVYVLPSEPPLEPDRQPAYNLPIPPTPLIGRESQIEGARALLLQPEVRLVSVTGPPGVGKTRLSLQVAAGLSEHFEGGVFFVSLASITNPRLAITAIAQTVGLKEAGSKALHERLKEHVQGKHVLLLLDNLEQVAQAAPFVSDLLKSSPLLKLLATSRTLLHVYGEHEFPVYPFELPPVGRDTSLVEIAQNDAVELFVRRARAARPDFRLTEDNAPAVAEICARLDGLPLAIELAAARIKLLPPQAMLARLQGWGQRLHLLKDGAQDLPTRQQTLRNAIDWSYDLLHETQKQLLRRLAVFTGGFSIDAVEEVCGMWKADFATANNSKDHNANIPYSSRNTPNSSDVLDCLASLANKSLLRHDGLCCGEPRFSMLETIREYALEQLEESGEGEEVRLRHARYFLALAERGDLIFQGKAQTRDHAPWLERLEAEQDNMRAVFDWCMSVASQPRMGELALQLAGALGLFWEMRGHLTEGRELAGAALARSDANARTAPRAKALLALGKVSLWQGTYSVARAELEEGLSIWRELGDPAGTAVTLLALGHVALAQGEYAQARAFLEESLSIRSDLGYEVGVASSLQGLGVVAFHEGDCAQALNHLQESLGIARRMEHKWIMVRALSYLGHVRLFTGDPEAAVSAFAEALTLSLHIASKPGATRALMGLAGVAATQQQWDQAARLFGAANGLLDPASVCIYPHDCAAYERALAATRAALGEERFASLSGEGERIPPERFATSTGESVGPHATEQAVPPPIGDTEIAVVGGSGELSSRELEVLQLIALGLTNDQIARKLIISSHTVNNHLRSIFRKLGVASRSAATRYAVLNKLV